jgi:hypothetical protein
MAGGKCKGCGLEYDQRYPQLFSFHHRQPSRKSFGLNIRNLDRSWGKIIQEFNKCDLYCLNCHAKLHTDKRNVLR